ncbi:hypothetical protein NUW54_g12576 [Trametes sanguinea]|uniref:Uncharacterized protein n=1 Tax=Trametes sanguinea TaxID=158606 RepID=A0ACC1MVT6_9APHY|nr:hypothetical protein NUW54_g12576 [Trametes sanguinea]
MRDAEAQPPTLLPVPDAGPASSANVNGLSLIRSIPHHQFLHGVIESLREFEEDWLLKLSEAGAPHVSNDNPVLKSESGLIALSIQLGTVIFMPTRLLSTIADQFRAGSIPTSVSPKCRTVTHDVESFGWVFLYTFYRRALADEELKDSNSELHEGLSYEFSQMFLNASVKTLHAQRVSLLAREDYSPIAMLRAYAKNYLKSRPLATFVTRVWTVLKRCPKTEPSVSKPASDDLGEARLLRVANNKRRQLGRKNQWTERSLPPVPSEEAQERWNNIDHIEWLTLLSVMIEDLEKDERN